MVLVSLSSQQHWPCARPCLPRMPLSSLWVWPRPGLEGAGGSQSTLPTLPIHWDFQGTIVVMGCLGTAQAPGAAPGPASSPSDPRGAPSVRPAWRTPPSSHWSTCQVRHTQQGLYKCLLQNGGPDPVTQPPGLSVPICGTEHKHQAGSTLGARGRARSLTPHRPCAGLGVGTWQRTARLGADGHVAEGSPAAGVPPGRTGPRPLPCLAVPRRRVPAGWDSCVSRPHTTTGLRVSGGQRWARQDPPHQGVAGGSGGLLNGPLGWAPVMGELTPSQAVPS